MPSPPSADGASSRAGGELSRGGCNPRWPDRADSGGRPQRCRILNQDVTEAVRATVRDSPRTTLSLLRVRAALRAGL